MQINKNLQRLFVVSALIVLLPACASTGPDGGHSDPLEGYNRAMFKVNDVLDKAVLKPVAKGYQIITPGFVDTGISNFFSNLGDISVAFNNFLQLKPGAGVSDVGRVLTNTTLGVAGFFDVASEFGMRKHNEDFGQTLGFWGVGPGPYLVLPLFGPSNFRDGPARFVDSLTNPIFYVDDDTIRWSLIGVTAIDSRADLLSAEEVVDDIAYDKYVTIRDAYLDNRQFLVYDGDPPDADLFDELDEDSEPFEDEADESPDALAPDAPEAKPAGSINDVRAPTVPVIQAETLNHAERVDDAYRKMDRAFRAMRRGRAQI